MNTIRSISDLVFNLSVKSALDSIIYDSENGLDFDDLEKSVDVDSNILNYLFSNISSGVLQLNSTPVKDSYGNTINRTISINEPRDCEGNPIKVSSSYSDYIKYLECIVSLLINNSTFSSAIQSACNEYNAIGLNLSYILPDNKGNFITFDNDNQGAVGIIYKSDDKINDISSNYYFSWFFFDSINLDRRNHRLSNGYSRISLDKAFKRGTITKYTINGDKVTVNLSDNDKDYLKSFDIEPLTGTIYKNGIEYIGSMVEKGRNSNRVDKVIRLYFNSGFGKDVKDYQAICAAVFEGYDLDNDANPDNVSVDHINENNLDNRVGNLQIVTTHQNLRLHVLRKKFIAFLSEKAPLCASTLINVIKFNFNI